MDFSSLPMWMQDLIPLLTFGTLAGVFFLTIIAILKFLYKTARKDKSGAD